MIKDDSIYIGHILDLARKSIEKVSGISRDVYEENEDIRLILAHLIQMIGEAANRVSLQGRDAFPTVPWKQIIGVRCRIVHDYMDVDYDVIWEIVRSDLPVLIEILEGSHDED